MTANRLLPSEKPPEERKPIGDTMCICGHDYDAHPDGFSCSECDDCGMFVEADTDD